MIFALLNNLKKQSFTGVAHIRTKSQNERTYWKVYFVSGKLIWANGGCHSQRAWERHLTQYFPQIDLKQIDIRSSQQYKCPEYNILGKILQGGLVTLENATKLVSSKIEEVFFDLFQQEKLEALSLETEQDSLSSLIGLDSSDSLISVDIEASFKQMQQQWSAWLKNGFTSICPNDAPRIKSQEQLKAAVPDIVYQNFIKLLDGRRSLRDLAVGMNKDLLLLTKSLFPYVQKGLLEIVEVPDLNTIRNSATNSDQKPQNLADRPLIACIDDSPQICMIMEQIITRANYRFLGIQQPIQAVPRLISVNPKMIFLDIGMPIINGYEVCTQIRRVSKLQQVPIIMLTGNDGVFDRVKAKVCGASDFISKPVEIEKILQTIDKFSAANVPVTMMSN